MVIAFGASQRFNFFRKKDMETLEFWEALRI